MGVYNFKDQFEQPIMDNTKLHTIRAKRKHPDKPGNTLYLYVGLRTKRARKLKEVTCVRIDDIVITQRCRGVPKVRVAGVWLDRSERELLARKDGFKDFEAMAAFWVGRLPFRGDMIHWRNK